MALILLTNAPYCLEERYGKLAPLGATLPNLGLLMLGAALRKAGNRVRIIDASAQGLSYENVVAEIKKSRPDFIGLTSVTPAIIKTAKLAGMIKEVCPSTRIIIGGPHFTAVPEQTLAGNPCFDYGVLGEGEETIVELVEALSSGKTPSSVPGVVFREEDKIHFVSRRKPIDNLDALPFPAWDLLDGFPSKYRPAIFKYKRLPSAHIVSARGCPNKCVFCDTSIFGHKVRFHSAEYVLDMVDYLTKDFKIKEIIFEDDQFIINKSRLEKICNGFLERGSGIAWACSGRINSIKDFELLKLMKRSGCWQINYGIESGNQAILDFMKKGITLDQVEKAVKLTRKAGILSKGYFILGFPHETVETLNDTIEFAKRVPLNDISAFMLTPYPGSEVYDIAKVYGTFEQDVEKMNLLDVVYVPEGLSREVLLCYQKRFMKEFYLRPGIIADYCKKIIGNPGNLVNLLKAFRGFLIFMQKSPFACPRIPVSIYRNSRG